MKTYMVERVARESKLLSLLSEFFLVSLVTPAAAVLILALCILAIDWLRRTPAMDGCLGVSLLPVGSLLMGIGIRLGLKVSA